MAACWNRLFLGLIVVLVEPAVHVLEEQTKKYQVDT